MNNKNITFKYEYKYLIVQSFGAKSIHGKKTKQRINKQNRDICFHPKGEDSPGKPIFIATGLLNSGLLMKIQVL